MMKSKLNMTGILGVLLIFILIFTGCSNGTTDDELVATFTDVYADYPLTSGQSGLTLTAKKSDTTGIIYLTISGTVAAADTSQTAWTNNWNKKGNISGKFAAVSVDFNGVFTTANVAKILAIRSESQALRYCTDWVEEDGHQGLLSSAPTVAYHWGANMWIPSNPSQLPVRWKAYEAGLIPANDSLLILIWDGASPKTSKLEVTSWTSFNGDIAKDKTGDIATIVFDYSAVTFTP
ncbi:MAG: hypothetical protein LBK74_03855 [Treponema sp.]|jgi:hypothetical protein|nr:hypothetical protein [Treponema sp.]